MFPLHVSLEASNFTQMPLQLFCADLWLKPHPLSNKLSIITGLGQWLPLQTEKKSFTPRNGGLASHGMQGLHFWE